MSLTFKKAFTLMEVNIAIFIMSVGILSMVSLYSLGYREQSQSREDVEAAAMAENFIAPLVSMLSNSDLDWDAFNRVSTSPEKGWADYVRGTSLNAKSDDKANSDRNYTLRVVTDSEVKNLATAAFNEIANKCGKSPCKFDCPTLGSDDPKVALVVVHNPNSPVISIALRCGKRVGSLLEQPLYYTEVHFQGVHNQ